MLKIRDIVWEKMPFNPHAPNYERTQGMVGENYLFVIEKKGIKTPKFVLQSLPFRNGVFTRANNSKKLGEYYTENAAKEAAVEKLKEFVQLLVDSQ